MMAPEARLNDGLFDLLIVRNLSRHKLLKLFPKIFSGDHIHSDFVEFTQTDSFALYPEDVPEVLNIDGQLKGTVPVEAEMLPAAIEVYVN